LNSSVGLIGLPQLAVVDSSIHVLISF